MNIQTQFQKARERSCPLIAINTPDNAATINWIQTKEENPNAMIITWDGAQGFNVLNSMDLQRLFELTETQSLSDLSNMTKDPGSALNYLNRLPDSSIAIFLNLHKYFNSPEIVQAIWNLRDEFKSNFRTLVMLSQDIIFPAEVSNDVIIFDEELPKDEDIVNIANSLYETAGYPSLDEQTQKRVIDTVHGLPSNFAIEQYIAMSLNSTGINFKTLGAYKRKTIEKTFGLSMWEGKETFDDLGGQKQIKLFLHQLFSGPKPPKCIVRIEEIEKILSGSNTQQGDSSGISQDAMAVTLTELEDQEYIGIILVGPAGSGKSLLSKCISTEFKVPGITLDYGGLKNSLVGESQQRVRAAMRVIRSVADRGGAFWVATCNQHESLTPELKRRFSFGFWYCGLPDEDEKIKIWEIQRKKYNISDLEDQPDDYRLTGADIRNICEISYRLHISLIEARNYIVPISISDPGSINRMEESAHNRFLSSSYPGPFLKQIETKTLKRSLSKV